MSQITDILNEVVSRVSGIADIETVVKGNKQFNPDEAPGIYVYRGTSENMDHQDEAPSLMEVPITVDYYRDRAGDENTSDRAESMVDQILAAVETSDGYLDGVLCEPIYALSDSVIIPENAGGVIQASVIFNCQFVRQYGG